MLVKFIKKCRWSFGERTKSFGVGNIKDINTKDAEDMIKHGYAVVCQKKHPTVTMESNSNESTKLDDKDRAKRSVFYEVKFTMPGLKQFCKDNGVVVKSNIHRTKPMIIEAILDFEKESGLIKEKNV
jgi:hypothetical protein